MMETLHGRVRREITFLSAGHTVRFHPNGDVELESKKHKGSKWLVDAAALQFREKFQEIETAQAGLTRLPVRQRTDRMIKLCEHYWKGC